MQLPKSPSRLAKSELRWFSRSANLLRRVFLGDDRHLGDYDALVVSVQDFWAAVPAPVGRAVTGAEAPGTLHALFHGLKAVASPAAPLRRAAKLKRTQARLWGSRLWPTHAKTGLAWGNRRSNRRSFVASLLRMTALMTRALFRQLEDADLDQLGDGQVFEAATLHAADEVRRYAEDAHLDQLIGVRIVAQRPDLLRRQLVVSPALV